MIFYFSATGNSLYAAKKIGEYNQETLINIAAVMNRKEGKFEYTLRDDEVIGFVFPLFAWSAPEMIFDFLAKAKFNNYKNNYLFILATYGQNVGRFDKFLAKALEDKGMKLNGAFALNMPNNYIMIWDRDRQNQCLEAAEKTLVMISETIKQRKDAVEIRTYLNGLEVEPGRVEEFAPVMNARFNQTLKDASEFYVTEACNGCGLCAKVCNGQTIRLADGKPNWGNNCTKCLACLHLCPERAIQFGKITETTGRYKNPHISLEELMVFPDGE